MKIIKKIKKIFKIFVDKVYEKCYYRRCQRDKDISNRIEKKTKSNHKFGVK